MSTEKQLHLIKNNNQRRRKTKIERVLRLMCVHFFYHHEQTHLIYTRCALHPHFGVCRVFEFHCTCCCCCFFFSCSRTKCAHIVWCLVLHAIQISIQHWIDRLLCIMWKCETRLWSFNTFSSSIFLFLLVPFHSSLPPHRFLFSCDWRDNEKRQHAKIITNYFIIRSDIFFQNFQRKLGIRLHAKGTF